MDLYEQKYNAALQRAKERYSACSAPALLEYIFPELKENEDERIRKELITHCRNTRCTTEEGGEKIAKWIAWLEKQCHMLDPDKVIEWLNDQACQGWIEVDKFVDKFKEDFGL